MHPPASRGKPGSGSEVGHWGELMRHLLAALSCGLAMLCLAAGEGRAVLAQEKPPLAFDVVSVRASTGPPFSPGIQAVAGRFTATDMPVGALIRRAYGVPYWKVKNAPDWVNTERLTVRAAGPASATPAQMNLMLQTLLEQRFRLVVATESREMDADELILARADRQLGPGMHPVSIDCESNELRAGSPPGLFGALKTRPRCGNFLVSFTFKLDDPRSGRRGSLTQYAAITVGHLADTLSASRDRPVLDRTGVEGLFDIELNYATEEAPPAAFDAPATAVSPSSAPTLPVALEQQLGFRLRRNRHQIEILRIRSVERPRADEN